MPGITVGRWDAAEFMGRRAEWDELMTRSSADPLYLSWQWQTIWWDTFAAERGLELFLLTAHDGGRLVGIAPLFRQPVRFRGGIRAVSVQFIGNCWRWPGTVRTERLDFITDRNRHEDVVRAFLDHLWRERAEILLSDMDTDSVTWRLVTDEARARGAHIRQADGYEAYEIELKGTFADYLAALGSNTRLHLFNRRKLVEKRGEVTLASATPETVDAAFEILARLQRARWDREVFADGRQRFHRALAARLAAQGALNLSILSVGGEPVSALYNMRAGDREYNIHGGFDDGFDKKVALGFLHHGYLIEQAYHDGLRFYDLLGGGGKKDQYKSRMADTRNDFGTLQVVRGLRLKLLLRAYDRLRR